VGDGDAGRRAGRSSGARQAGYRGGREAGAPGYLVLRDTECTPTPPDYGHNRKY